MNSDNTPLTPEQPWLQGQKEESSMPMITQPKGKISRSAYIALTILIMAIAIPILIFGGIMTLMTPMLAASGNKAEAYLGVFLVPIVTLILPCFLLRKLLQWVHCLYEP